MLGAVAVEVAFVGAVGLDKLAEAFAAGVVGDHYVATAEFVELQGFVVAAGIADDQDLGVYQVEVAD